MITLLWGINWQGAVVITRSKHMVTSARSRFQRGFRKCRSIHQMVARSEVGVKDDNLVSLVSKKGITIP